jgi:hypothetical protein
MVVNSVFFLPSTISDEPESLTGWGGATNLAAAPANSMACGWVPAAAQYPRTSIPLVNTRQSSAMRSLCYYCLSIFGIFCHIYLRSRMHEMLSSGILDKDSNPIHIFCVSFRINQRFMVIDCRTVSSRDAYVTTKNNSSKEVYCCRWRFQSAKFCCLQKRAAYPPSTSRAFFR